MTTDNTETSDAQMRTVDYLLIGGGLASATAAEEIRSHDPTGSILIVCGENQPPYHRPPLSKAYLRREINAEGVYNKGGVYVQPPQWYDQHHVELVQGTLVIALDTQAKMARLSDGTILNYDKALIATGGRPRQLDVPGFDLPGVHTLRTLADATAIRTALAGGGKHILIVGSGFIGLECAANSLFLDAATVTIIDPVSRVWPTMLSPNLSIYLQTQYTRRGAKTYYNYTLAELQAGEDGQLTGARLTPVGKRGQEPFDIPCDIAIFGVGIELNAQLAQAAGLTVDRRHGVVVDDHLRASAPDVYAAGDVAGYPDPVMGLFHSEHWDNAIASAKVAAANMTGADLAYQHVPYFFSDQFDLQLKMLGYPTGTAQVIVRGEVANDRFTSLYNEGGILRAALTINDDAQIDLLHELIARGAHIPDDPAQLLDPTFDLAGLLQTPSPTHSHPHRWAGAHHQLPASPIKEGNWGKELEERLARIVHALDEGEIFHHRRVGDA